MTTEWTGNDGANWVALSDTEFDANISPVATLDDIGDPGTGVFLPLAGGTMVGTLLFAGADLNMGANPINGVGSLIGHSATDIIIQSGVGRNTKFNNNVGAEILNLLPTEAFFSVIVSLQGNNLNMGEGSIVDVSNIIGDVNNNLNIDTRTGGSLTLGQAAGVNWLYLDDDEAILTELTEFRDGAYISTYNPLPPPYGGGDTFWYQARNIRFKDTPGAPSDSEGQDGDVCLMYTF